MGGRLTEQQLHTSVPWAGEARALLSWESYGHRLSWEAGLSHLGKHWLDRGHLHVTSCAVPAVLGEGTHCSGLAAAGSVLESLADPRCLH